MDYFTLIFLALFHKLGYNVLENMEVLHKMRLIQWEFYTHTEFSRIYPGLYECLSPALEAGV